MFVSRKMIFVVVLAILVIVGVGAVFANSHGNTYTGCLDPGGTIIHVAIGDQPAHECARSHTQISWNETGPPGADGADGVSGYFVRKQASSYTDIQPGFSFRVDAICPIGKKPIGGGHEFLFPPSITDLIHVYKSSPQDFDDGLTGWRVEFKNYGQGSVSGLVSAIAICANVGP